MRRLLVVVVAATLFVRIAGGSGSVEAAVPILGSGSTFAEVALDAWASDIYVEYGFSVDFSGSGSVGGLSSFQSSLVDFASSDVPYPEGSGTQRPYAYTPIVAGGTALMYNLVDPAGNRIENLRLTPKTIANIFFGNISNWRDPAILAENPELESRMPDWEVRLGVRQTGSGTTGVFTDFMSTFAPEEWRDFLSRSQTVALAGGKYITDWPASTAQFDCRCSFFAGSREIANYVAQRTQGSQGAIGYAEAAYAIQLSLPVVRIRNEAGFYRLPDARSVAVALLGATENGDGTQNLSGVHTNPRDEAYPASSYNYLVIPTGADFSVDKGETLSEFLVYSVTVGQDKADALGYSPLPANLVQFALNRVAQINGHIEAPPLGDWGRAYERLAPDVPQVVNETPDNAAPVDPGGAPVDPDTQVDAEGNTVDAQGNRVDAQGRTIDAQGNPIDPAAPASDVDPSATTTTIAGAASPGGPTTTLPAGRRTTATSIAADGSIIYLDEDAVGGASSRTGLCDLEFDDEGNLTSCDGEPVPEVETIGVGQLLGVAGVVAGLILLPPLVIGPFVRRRRETGDVATT